VNRPAAPEANANELDLAALSMLASAVAGQPIVVSPAAPSQRTHVNGREILLPAMCLPEARQAVVLQALLLSVNSLHEPGLRRLIGQPRPCQRYMQWELARALNQHGQRLPASMQAWLQSHAATPCPASSAQSVDWALQVRRPTQAPPWPAHLGIVRAAQATWQRLSGQQSAPISTTTSDAIDTNDDDAEEDPLASKLLQWFSTPMGGGSISNLFLKLLGFGASAKGNTAATTTEGVASALAGEHQVQAAPTEDAQQLKVGQGAKVATLPPAQAHTGALHYPEWFEREGRYKQRWVSLQEFTPNPGTLDSDSTPHPKVRVSAASIRSQIAKVGVEFERHRAQPDGQDFDLDALITHAVEGHQSSGGARLYQAARRTKRDLTLLVLLDVSHSTGDRNEEGVRIIDQQIAMAREITHASAQLGDQIGVYAFHSWGRHLVHCLRIKGFGERLSQQIDHRLNALAPAGMTRMGAAIRHATALMAREKHHSHRIILLLSDGFAYDDEYEGTHAQADTAKALDEAQANGIGCVCLNIGSHQDDEVLQKLYGHSAYLRCADTSRAIPALRRLMRSAILGAASSHGRKTQTK
jgi:nitric oxide reductase NorD protein